MQITDTKIKWLEQRHEYWWEYLLEKLECLTRDHLTYLKKSPICELAIRTSIKTAWANFHRVQYNLNFLYTTSKKEYDQTICHEICHVFSYRYLKSKGHSKLWKMLFNNICKQQRGRFHDYYLISKKVQNTLKF